LPQELTNAVIIGVKAIARYNFFFLVVGGELFMSHFYEGMLQELLHCDACFGVNDERLADQVLAVPCKLDAIRQFVRASHDCSTKFREGVSVEGKMPRDDKEEHYSRRPDVGLEAIVLLVTPDLRGDVVRSSNLGLGQRNLRLLGLRYVFG